MVLNDDDAKVVLDKLDGFFLSLIVSRSEVKLVKSALERHALLDKFSKIAPFVANRDIPIILPKYDVQRIKQGFDVQRQNATKSIEASWRRHDNPQQVPPDSTGQRYVIPTNFEVLVASRTNDDIQANQAKDQVLQKIGLVDQAGIEAYMTFRRRPSTRLNESDKSPLAQAVREWLHSLPSHIHSKLPMNVDQLPNTCKWTYTIYAPMLLLPPNCLSQDPWPELLEDALRPFLPDLYKTVCEQLKVTHIAINRPIPALLPSSNNSAQDMNVLRLPSNLVPLHGEFGEPNLPATDQNFRGAFWVSTIQNNITQTWAPLYTMFSRGNIKEKTRLLSLISTPSDSVRGGLDGIARESSAVDLYAGIGYFAFSYAKAGVAKVLCWEINGWSIEGLRRGAKKNGWSIQVVDNEQVESMLDDSHQNVTGTGQERLVVFHESNVNAAKRVEALKSRIPRIRHVNCGYLPSSSGSWDVAVQVLDATEGGCIHAHENVVIKDMERRKYEVVNIFRHLANQYLPQNSAASFCVECQHIEEVKAYAPGIVHCVFDITILPKTCLNGVA
ncbi:MAG: hypothetical protein Q9170_004749 [Blastenia crenularia]